SATPTPPWSSPPTTGSCCTTSPTGPASPSTRRHPRRRDTGRPGRRRPLTAPGGPARDARSPPGPRPATVHPAWAVGAAALHPWAWRARRPPRPPEAWGRRRGAGAAPPVWRRRRGRARGRRPARGAPADTTAALGAAHTRPPCAPRPSPHGPVSRGPQTGGAPGSAPPPAVARAEQSCARHAAGTWASSEPTPGRHSRTHRPPRQPPDAQGAPKPRPPRPAPCQAPLTVVVTGVPVSTVRLTVHRRSWEVLTARGRTVRARSAPSPSGKVTVKATVRSVMRLPRWSLILSPDTVTVNVSGSLRRPVAASTSAAVQPPIAASRSSTGVKAVSGPSPEEALK